MRSARRAFFPSLLSSRCVVVRLSRRLLSSVLVPTRPQALPMLREAVAQDGSSLEPMDAETSAQVAELLTCIERDLGGAA